MAVGDTLQLTPSETVTIRQSDPELLEVEAVYGPGGSPPPPHLHPSQDEHFEVLEGEITVRIEGGEETHSGVGEKIAIPRGTKHQMWNSSSAPTRLRWETRPALRTEEWFRTVDRLVHEAGGKMPGPAAFLSVLPQYEDVFRLAVGPEWAQKPLQGALGAIGKLRGKLG